MFSVLLIFLAFTAIHSITVSARFKELCRQRFGAVFLRVWYRFLYSCLSIVTAGAAFACISRVPDQVLWQGPAWLRWSLHAVRFGALLFGARAFEHLDGAEFLGIRQVWRYLTRRDVSGNAEGLTERGLVTSGVYGIVRHPLYLAGIIFFTLEPDITRNGAVLSALADCYFVFGALIEERRFLRMFGDQYREYMKRVPRLAPRFRSGEK